MTSIYFIRHAQPDHDWEEDGTRPLSDEGMNDSKRVTEFFREMEIEYYISSPYKRSIDTIKESADGHGISIALDERLRERESGLCGNNMEMFKRRWENLDFHEECGESLKMVQERNIKAIFEILINYKDANIVIGTHGTALSTILNYFEPAYCCDDFLRMIDFMPYIIRLDFDGINYIGKEELLIVKKEFKGKK
ncbi:histidine phosphatase family protein [Clostridium sp. 'White wine YQ']|uniref:histidine phosphatase family protein n=1 Tax=Clostridium sp. 'White wine YQ' TaxID=3027474 RepID=UPI0023673F36|nr:histidine phosphatase family protein [Clostridium sp. 'White wine YQ']MDD7793065.1 histidine phosphatase family protein [Clostridium sp. 'White wine YQ']